jgi:hypothetical protein
MSRDQVKRGSDEWRRRKTTRKSGVAYVAGSALCAIATNDVRTCVRVRAGETWRQPTRTSCKMSPITVRWECGRTPCDY